MLIIFFNLNKWLKLVRCIVKCGLLIWLISVCINWEVWVNFLVFLKRRNIRIKYVKCINKWIILWLLYFLKVSFKGCVDLEYFFEGLIKILNVKWSKILINYWIVLFLVFFIMYYVLFIVIDDFFGKFVLEIGKNCGVIIYGIII